MLDEVEFETSIARVVGLHAHTAEGVGKPLIVALHGGGFSSAYYTQPGFSLIDALEARGMDAVLLDRPGYGRSRFHEEPAEILSANATALSEAVAALWAEDKGRHTGIVLLGHSIGGAIALMMATMPQDWPLLGISVSGIGDRAPPGLSLPVSDIPAGEPFRLPRDAVAALFFKSGAASARALDGIMAAAEAIDLGEATEIYSVWTTVAPTILAGVAVPVQMIFAQHETLWAADEESVARIHATLTAAPLKDVQVFPDVGHCIEFHAESSDFYGRVLSFCEGC